MVWTRAEAKETSSCDFAVEQESIRTSRFAEIHVREVERPSYRCELPEQTRPRTDNRSVFTSQTGMRLRFPLVDSRAGPDKTPDLAEGTARKERTELDRRLA